MRIINRDDLKDGCVQIVYRDKYNITDATYTTDSISDLDDRLEIFCRIEPHTCEGLNDFLKAIHAYTMQELRA